MDFAKHYRTDETGEAEGVWIDWAEGTRLKVARLGNPAYQKRFQALPQPHRHLRDRGLLPEDVQSIRKAKFTKHTKQDRVRTAN